MSKRVELGCAGHLIVSDMCLFRRHTQVGNYRVSTVGNYHPPNTKARSTIGAGEKYFETMVFRLTDKPADASEGCGCREVADWCEIACKRYATAGEAQAGHEAFVAEYERGDK